MIKWSVIYSLIPCDPQGATMVGAERRNFANLSCSDRSKSQSQTSSNIFLSSFTTSNWWLWIWVHAKMYKKNISDSVAFKVFFFIKRIKMLLSAIQLKPCLKQLNGAHTWSYYHAVNLCRLECSRCSAEKKQNLVQSFMMKTAF